VFGAAGVAARYLPENNNVEIMLLSLVIVQTLLLIAGAVFVNRRISTIIRDFDDRQAALEQRRSRQASVGEGDSAPQSPLGANTLIKVASQLELNSAVSTHSEDVQTELTRHSFEDWYIVVTVTFNFIACYMCARLVGAARVWKTEGSSALPTEESSRLLHFAIVYTIAYVISGLVLTARVLPWATLMFAVPPFMDCSDDLRAHEVLEARPNGITSQVGAQMLARRGMEHLAGGLFAVKSAQNAEMGAHLGGFIRTQTRTSTTGSPSDSPSCSPSLHGARGSLSDQDVLKFCDGTDM